MLKICLVFCKSEPYYAYKSYAYQKNIYNISTTQQEIPRCKDGNRTALWKTDMNQYLIKYNSRVKQRLQNMLSK